MSTPYIAPTKSKAGLTGDLETVRVSKTLTAVETEALVAGDLVLGILIPLGGTVVDILFEGTDMDSGATLTWDIGDTVDPNRYTATPISGQAATFWRYTTDVALATAYQYTGTLHETLSLPDDAKRIVAIGCETISGTGLAGTVTLTVRYIT